jgi:hypothetical protein
MKYLRRFEKKLGMRLAFGLNKRGANGWQGR